MLRDTSVLVVDDEEVMREILQTLLEREGCRVSVAVNGEDGLALARAQPFDVAVVDVMMPGLDGISTLDELKKIGIKVFSKHDKKNLKEITIVVRSSAIKNQNIEENPALI